MKIFTLSVFLILFTVCFTVTGMSQNFTPEEENSLSKTYIGIVNDLKTLINSKKNIKDKYISILLETTLERLKSKELRLAIRTDLDENIFGGCAFELISSEGARDRKPTLAFSPFMIKLYKKKPSIVLSAFIHEAQHAKSYFNSPERYMITENNILEKYLYELDSYNAESRFIRDYLVDNRDYSLTKFEKFLVASFKKDYLAYFSHSLLGYDMKLTFFLNDIHRNKISYQKKLELVSKVIGELKEINIEKGKDDWEKYSSVVSIYTALKFCPQTIRDIDHVHGKIADKGEYTLKKYQPKLLSQLLELEKLYLKYQKSYLYLNKIRAVYMKVE